MKRNFIIAIVLLAVMCALAAVISDNFLIGLFGILLVPLVLAFDICFYVMPFAIIILATLGILQFVIKDYKKFDKYFMIFIMILLFGLLNWKIENAVSATGYFMTNEIIKIYVLISGLSVIGAILSYISKKKDTRYYLPIIITICCYTIYYCFFRGV